MRSSLAHLFRNFRWIHLVLIACLTVLLSGWTCSALFVSCQGIPAQTQITSLSPDTIPNDAESVLLIVVGDGFFPQSQIMWNGNALQTTFMDSQHLQTTITQQILESFGGSAGSSVQIFVRTQQGFNDGCPVGGNSGTLVLVIS